MNFFKRIFKGLVIITTFLLAGSVLSMAVSIPIILIDTGYSPLWLLSYLPMMAVLGYFVAEDF